MNKPLLVFAAVTALLLAGVAAAQYPMMDAVADRLVQRYQQSSCEQLWHIDDDSEMNEDGDHDVCTCPCEGCAEDDNCAGCDCDGCDAEGCQALNCNCDQDDTAAKKKAQAANQRALELAGL